MSTKAPKTDTQHVEAVLLEAAALNNALRAAREAGLVVSLDFMVEPSSALTPSGSLLRVNHISRTYHSVGGTTQTVMRPAGPFAGIQGAVLMNQAMMANESL